MEQRFLPALGAGLFETVEEAVDRMLRKKEVYNPNMKNHELYNRYFQIYKDAYKALSDANIYERLVKLALENK